MKPIYNPNPLMNQLHRTVQEQGGDFFGANFYLQP